MFTGKGQLINRLSMQVGSKAKAIEILKKRGHLQADGKTFTAEGERRNEMTAAERAIGRSSKRLGKPVENFLYDPLTNYAKFIKNI